MALSRPFTLSSRSRSSTPALRAAAYMLSSNMSQPVKTRSLRPARGTNSLILGERPSVRLPRRMVPICVSEPMGCAIPLRTASTPATNVVATAPMPGIITPSLPFAGSIAFPAPLGTEWEDFTSTVAFLAAVLDFVDFAFVDFAIDGRFLIVGTVRCMQTNYALSRVRLLQTRTPERAGNPVQWCSGRIGWRCQV